MIMRKPKKTNLKRLFLIKSVKDKKRNRKYARKYVKYHDHILDQYLLEDEKENDENIRKHLQLLNSIPITEDYRRILIENNLGNWDKRSIANEKYETIKKIAEVEALLILNNLAYAKSIKDNTDFNKDKYAEEIGKKPNVNRNTILNESIPKGSKVTGRYQNPQLAAENLYRKNQMETAHQSATINPEIKYKTWIWSELENTRHSNMDGDTVGVDEDFLVVNEITGEEDYMQYPHDPKGSPANICNCGCDVLYSSTYGGLSL